MKFEDAVKKSVKQFLAGKMPEATNKLVEGGIFFTPDYFDELEAELAEDEPKAKKSKKKKESVDGDV
jgi:hypothetical protein